MTTTMHTKDLRAGLRYDNTGFLTNCALTNFHMYGLVNQAIEDLVRAHHGGSIWELIKQKAEVQVEAFIGMEQYPDNVTYKLVDAAAEVLQVQREEVLREFGEYWVLFTAKKGYGEMLAAGGQTLPEFLQNLDALHTRVGIIMPHLRPPSFSCTDITAHSLHLHYYSDREGLTHMVAGLVQGLGKMFSTDVEVALVEGRDTGGDHDVFRVSWS